MLGCRRGERPGHEHAHPDLPDARMPGRPNPPDAPDGGMSQPPNPNPPNPQPPKPPTPQTPKPPTPQTPKPPNPNPPNPNPPNPQTPKPQPPKPQPPKPQPPKPQPPKPPNPQTLRMFPDAQGTGMAGRRDARMVGRQDCRMLWISVYAGFSSWETAMPACVLRFPYALVFCRLPECSYVLRSYALAAGGRFRMPGVG